MFSIAIPTPAVKLSIKVYGPFASIVFHCSKVCQHRYIHCIQGLPLADLKSYPLRYQTEENQDKSKCQTRRKLEPTLTTLYKFVFMQCCMSPNVLSIYFTDFMCIRYTHVCLSHKQTDTGDASKNLNFFVYFIYDMRPRIAYISYTKKLRILLWAHSYTCSSPCCWTVYSGIDLCLDWLTSILRICVFSKISKASSRSTVAH